MSERYGNPPQTAVTPANRDGGILVVLLPGYGPKNGTAEQTSLPSGGLITASHIDRGPAVAGLLDWLRAAHWDMKTLAPRFSLTVWPPAWDGPHHGPQMLGQLTRHAGAFVEVINQRKPSVILMVSCILLDAINQPEIRQKISPIFGCPLEAPHRITATRQRVLQQRWERALCVALPVPGRQVSQQTAQAIIDALSRIGHLL